MFSRNGFWIKWSINGKVLLLLRVEHETDTYAYCDGVWEKREPCRELGMSDDFDKVTEEEALKILKLEKW